MLEPMQSPSGRMWPLMATVLAPLIMSSICIFTLIPLIRHSVPPFSLRRRLMEKIIIILL